MHDPAGRRPTGRHPAGILMEETAVPVPTVAVAMEIDGVAARSSNGKARAARPVLIVLPHDRTFS